MTVTNKGLLSTAAALFLHHPNQIPVTAAWHTKSVPYQRLGLIGGTPYCRTVTSSSSSSSLLHFQNRSHHLHGCKSCHVKGQPQYFMSSNDSSSSPTQDVHMIQFETAKSTQDEARRILQSDFDFSTTNHCFAITTTEQSQGRGTSGRDWIGKRGNTFLTIAIPQQDIQIPITLLPLQIGCILAQQVKFILNKDTSTNTNGTKTTDSLRNVVQLKWPNDVLIDKKKVAGILIESERCIKGDYYFLVGIGVNWRYAPLITQVGPQNGREATCIYDCIRKDGDDGRETLDGVEEARQLASNVAQEIYDWIKFQREMSEENIIALGENIVREWERSGDFSSRQIIRDTQEVVFPMALEKDGRLRVRGQDGREKLLVSDYLL